MAGRAGTGGAVLWVLATVAMLSWAAAMGAEPRQSGTAGAQRVRLPSDSLCCDVVRSDAALADVCFADRQRGWAVGDRGTIWHTEDGGDRWHLQQTDVSCRLESVFFLDAQTGWAAGGWSHPFLHTSTGVVLSTQDGGQHWTTIPKLLLPGLKRVRFFNERRGWAVGNPSAMFPAGVFVTDSGGRGWNCLPGPRTPGWLTGAFLDPTSGAVAGRTALAAAVRQGALGPAQTPPLGLRDLTRMKLVAPGCGWLVGQGGLALLTTDLGSTWQTPAAELLPAGMARQFDFSALEVRGPKCWLAGSPGTRIFHTSDAGRSWIAAPTGQTTPIEAISFADDQNGWAVGRLGMILATADGGRTWRRQRSGGTRAAVLGLFSEPEDVPLELFARLSADDGYLAVAELISRRDVETPPRHDAHLADRAHEALVAVGACGARIAWQFPVRQAGLDLPVSKVVEGWDRAGDGRGLAELEAHLVRQIRLWRPDVIVTHDAGARGGDAVEFLVGQAVLQAAEQAADPACHPEQIELAGLGPWQVKKVYAALKPGGTGTTDLASSQLAPRLGRSLGELAAGPRALIEDRFRGSPQSLGFYLMFDRSPQELGRKDFFAGISLTPGSEARRTLLEAAAESMPTVRQIAQRRRNTQAILDRSLRDPQGAVRLLAEVGPLTQGLDADSSAQILCQMAENYYRSGQWQMAADAFEMLVDRHADHPLARFALVWLIRYHTSSEAQWRVEGQQRVTIQQTSATAETRDGTTQVAPRVFAAEKKVENKALRPLVPGSVSALLPQQNHRAERAAAMAARLEQTWPDLMAEPDVGFSLAALDRRRGQPRQAERFYLAQRRSPTRDTWASCAQGECWVVEPKGPPPKPLLYCVAAPSKPRLDGRLDDAVWKLAKPVELHSPQHDDAEWPCSLMLAYDDQFLYLAIRARQAAGSRYDPASGLRPRDADLATHDRVELFLDLDRDFTTYYRMAIDHRGWAREACWEDATWNPTWFVAAATSDGVWTAEAAIPLDQLTGRFPTSNTVWAIGLQRVVPGTGFQSWNAPAATEVIPEGFGYLIFE